jgi:hypothetical protein
METFLGHIRPSTTGLTDAIIVPSNMKIIVETVYISEVSGNPDTFSMFVDRINATFDEDNAMPFETPIEANQFIQISEANIILLSSNYKLVVQVGTADRINFSFFGRRIPL